MTKQTHFITIVSPNANTIVDIDLTQEEYELINRISTLTYAVADETGPIMMVSSRLPSLEDEKEEITLNTTSIPIIKPDIK